MQCSLLPSRPAYLFFHTETVHPLQDFKTIYRFGIMPKGKPAFLSSIFLCDSAASSCCLVSGHLSVNTLLWVAFWWPAHCVSPFQVMGAIHVHLVHCLSTVWTQSMNLMSFSFTIILLLANLSSSVDTDMAILFTEKVTFKQLGKRFGNIRGNVWFFVLFYVPLRKLLIDWYSQLTSVS